MTKERNFKIRNVIKLNDNVSGLNIDDAVNSIVLQLIEKYPTMITIKESDKGLIRPRISHGKIKEEIMKQLEDHTYIDTQQIMNSIVEQNRKFKSLDNNHKRKEYRESPFYKKTKSKSKDIQSMFDKAFSLDFIFPFFSLDRWISLFSN